MVLAFATTLAGLAGCQRETEAQKIEKSNREAQIALVDVGASTPVPDAVKTLNRVVVRFAAGSAEIPADAQPALKAAARAIDRLPKEAQLQVTGHADPSEEPGSGLTLGLKRAIAVVDFLYANGAPAAKVRPIGVGNQAPVGDNGSEEGRARNRRVEFRIAS